MKTDLMEKPQVVKDQWGICSGCGKERRADADGIAGDHGIWVAAAGEMSYPCPGAGHAVMRMMT